MKNEALRTKGFTLIELLLATLIFSIVVTAIYTTFSVGVTAWRKGEKNIRAYQDTRLIFNKMGTELRNAVIYANIKFIGEANRLYFTTRLPDRESKNMPSLYQIDYSLDNTNLLFKRQEENLFTSLLGQEKKIKETAFPVKEANFAYAGEPTESAWKESWTEEGSLPHFIKISLTFEDEKTPEGKITFSRTVLLPTAEIGNQHDN